MNDNNQRLSRIAATTWERYPLSPKILEEVGNNGREKR
jgi:hypothetical protein